MNIKKLGRKALKYLRRPRLVINYLAHFGIFNGLGDERYLRLIWWSLTGKRLDLERPRTFNEKLQWLKLHDRNPLYTTLVDKYAVKAWVAERIGAEHVIPTLGVWDSPDDIDLNVLPERFVLKTNHDCGGIAICVDRSTFDFGAAKEKLRAHLKRNYFWGNREWPYKDVKPLVFAEEYLENIKWEFQTWNFNGEPKMIAAIQEPHGRNEKKFYDQDWVELPFVSSLPELASGVDKPNDLAFILEASEALSEQRVFTRVDFLQPTEGNMLVGEITFYPAGGFVRWEPKHYDALVGQWLKLPDFPGGVSHES